MKKVFYILQITLLTMVMQTVQAQEQIAEPLKETKQVDAALAEKIKKEVASAKKFSGSELAKVPSDVVKAFEKKYDGATINEVVVSSSGVYKVKALKGNEKVIAYFHKNGKELITLSENDNSSEK